MYLVRERAGSSCTEPTEKKDSFSATLSCLQKATYKMIVEELCRSFLDMLKNCATRERGVEGCWSKGVMFEGLAALCKPVCGFWRVHSEGTNLRLAGSRLEGSFAKQSIGACHKTCFAGFGDWHTGQGFGILGIVGSAALVGSAAFRALTRRA